MFLFIIFLCIADLYCPAPPRWAGVIVHNATRKYHSFIAAYCEGSVAFKGTSLYNVTSICTEKGTWLPEIPYCTGQ